MKGRCMGVSLFVKLSQTKCNSRIKKSFPEDHVSECYSHVKKNRETPLCTCKKGSITLEAAVIIPLFAGFFAFVLFYFQIMQVQISVQGALEQTGRMLSVLSAKKENEIIEDVRYLSMAKGMMYAKLKEDKLIEQFVKGEIWGIRILESEFDGDYILLKADYIMDFPIKLFGNTEFNVSQKARFRKWTGWHTLSETSKKEMVYVTPHGEVYHLRKSCSYLTLSVRKAMVEEIVLLRNANGGKYKKCGLCERNIGLNEIIYITDYGDKYHFSVSCSGLKRTIYQKRLSEVGGMRPCRKCSK